MGVVGAFDPSQWIRDNPMMADTLVQMRVEGRVFTEIEAETGVDADTASQVVSAYLLDNYSVESVAEQRLLQLRRLEQIVGALWKQVMEGDFATEGKQTTNLINTLNSISDLLDLKKDRVRDEIVQLTRAQTEMVQACLDAARVHLLDSLLSMVASLPEDTDAAGIKDAMRTRLESAFSTVFADAASNGLREAAAPKPVQIGQGQYGASSIAK